MQKFQLNLTNLGSIRFLLIVLIVFVHVSPIISHGSGTVSFQIYFSQIVGRIAVPLYFFISGYLMSLGLNAFVDWKRKIKSRISTILIPYMLWNSIYGVGLIILAYRFGVESSFSIVDGVDDLIFKIFLSPAISPLWFLRDLFIFQFCSIGIVFLSIRLRILFLAVLMGFWLYDFHFFNSLISTEGALFFFLGIVNLLPAFRFFNKFRIMLFIVALGFSFVDLFFRYGDFWYSLLFHRITIVGLCYSFIYFLLDSNLFNNKLSKLDSISKYSFYVFVLHFPLLNIADSYLNSLNVVEYLLKVIIVILISISAGFMINLFPKISNLLTGNRS